MKLNSTSISLFILSLCLFFFLACENESKESDGIQPEIVILNADMVELDPLTYQFEAVVSGPAKDQISYEWDFGDGTIKEGQASENHAYQDEGEFTVKLTVTGGSGGLDTETLSIEAKVVSGSVDASTTYQTIVGFGGHDPRDKVNQLVSDLGMSVHRGELKWTFQTTEGGAYDFEAANSNSGGVDGLKELADAGVTTFMATLWSPPAWMKVNNSEEDDRSASYPNTTDNRLKDGMEDDLAEYIVKYIKMFETEIGVPLYAISVQNEPYFTQTFQSCMYTPTQLAGAIKALGKKIFLHLKRSLSMSEALRMKTL